MRSQIRALIRRQTAGRIFPVFGPAAGGNNVSVGSLDQAHIDSYKKYPLYNHVFVAEHNTYSNYNGLQVGLTRQTGKAHYSVNYTFSKALGILGIGGSSTYSFPADPFNYNNDYSNLPFDRRHIFNAAYSYDVGNVLRNKFAGAVTNGWQISGIFNYQKWCKPAVDQQLELRPGRLARGSGGSGRNCWQQHERLHNGHRARVPARLL